MSKLHYSTRMMWTKSRSAKVIKADGSKEKYSGDTRLRSEAQAPFRTFRLFVFGGLAAAAGLGTAFAVIRLVASLGGAPNAVDLPTGLKDLGIDVTALAGCLLVMKRDNDAKEKAMQRISREENLAKLKVELPNGRIVNLGQLRSFARPVIVAGSCEQVEQFMQASEPVRKELLERGVMTIPVALDGATPELPPLEKGEERWRASPVRREAWLQWLDEQKQAAQLGADQPVYLSLRMDGRVRGSGKGCPPWERLAVQLPKTDGIWKGLGDGFDGFVGEQ